MHTRNTTGTPEHGDADGGTHDADVGFVRLLVVTDRSDTARAAAALAREWAALFGAELRVLEVSEAGRGSATTRSGGAARQTSRDGGPLSARGATLGVRNRRLAEGIAEAARDCGADAIVLGIDHRRTTQRHLGRCLRDRLARTTPLPILVAPAFATAAQAGRLEPGPDAAASPRLSGRQLVASGRPGNA